MDKAPLHTVSGTVKTTGVTKAVFVATVAALAGCDSPVPNAPTSKTAADTPVMRASASYIGGFLLFKNNEDFPVKNCKLGLYLKNGDAYVLRWPALAAHTDTGVLSADSFIKLDVATRTATGEHLSSDAKPDAWMIYCDPPSGETIGGGGLIK